jgi:hypothetical protein
MCNLGLNQAALFLVKYVDFPPERFCGLHPEVSRQPRVELPPQPRFHQSGWDHRALRVPGEVKELGSPLRDNSLQPAVEYDEAFCGRSDAPQADNLLKGLTPLFHIFRFERVAKLAQRD